MRILPAISLFVCACTAMAPTAWADEADECARAAEESQSLMTEKKLKAARVDLLRCARDSCPGVIKKDCTNWLEDVDKRSSSIVLSAKDAKGDDLTEVTVTANGAPLASKLDGAALPIDPGETVFKFTAPGLPTVERRVVIAEGDKARSISVVLAKENAPAAGETNMAVKVAPWVLVGTSAASLAVFGALQGVARNELSALDVGCGKTRTCGDSDLGPIRNEFIGSGVALGVSIATLTAAVGIWVFAPHAKPTAPKISLGPTLDGFHAGATFVFR